MNTVSRLAGLFCFFSGTIWADEASIVRGEYLTTILGCGGCHTEGALLGRPAGPEMWLAGSKVGIAYSDYDEERTPGVVFPGNLTSDKETGLGRWSQEDILRMIRSGLNHQGQRALPVMPWPNYSLLADEDALDITNYLMSLPPVHREIPENKEAGEPSDASYVRIGVFIYHPTSADETDACEDSC